MAIRGARGRATAAPAAALLVGLSLWAVARGHDGYDLDYALLWGGQLLHAHVPSLSGPFAPTPHPLANLAGLLVAPLRRPAGADVLLGAVELSLGAAGVAAPCSRRSPPSPDGPDATTMPEPHDPVKHPLTNGAPATVGSMHRSSG
jgi:hypothetical protein